MIIILLYYSNLCWKSRNNKRRIKRQ